MNISKVEQDKYIGRLGGGYTVKPIIYIDVLFLVNFLINYILLWTTKKVSKIKISIIRLLIGALFGALYSIFMFFPSLKVYYTIVAKIFFSITLIAITYNIGKVKIFLKVLGMFYIVSFTFGGAALAIFYFTNIGAYIGAFVSNGIIYFKLPWKLLLISTLISYTIIKIIYSAFYKRFSQNNIYVPLYIIFENKSVCIKALIDTGNSLYDPISKEPVIVVEFSAIKELMPLEIQNLFYGSDYNDLKVISGLVSSSIWLSRFRLIPFSSLGKENGILIGFKPDEIKIIEEDENRILKNIILGIYNKQLSKNDKYNALLHPEIIT